MGVRAVAAPRGAIAIFQLDAIDAGCLDRMKPGLNNDIDVGLIHWDDLSNSRVSPLVNVLSGTAVVPEYEQYVRRLAAYRKSHKSPLFDAEIERTLTESAAKVGPEYAERGR